MRQDASGKPPNPPPSEASYREVRLALDKQVLQFASLATATSCLLLALFQFALMQLGSSQGNLSRVIFDCLVAIVSFASWLLIRQDRMKSGSRLFFTLIFLLLLLFPVVIKIGLYSIALFGLGCFILLAGFLFSPRTAIRLVVLCCLGVLAIFVVQIGGWMPIADQRRPSPLIIAITLIAIYIIIGWVTVKYAQLFDHTLQSLEENRRQLSLTVEGLMSSEEELRVAKDEAEHANKAKSSFLAMMSHEIRTPMNGILGMAQMLLESDLTETQRKEYARTIFNSGQSLLAILNDVLDLSKIEAGKIELESLVFSPAQLMQEAGAVFSETIRSKGLQLVLDTADNEPLRLRGDPTRIRQVLINLLGNAVKFTREGHIRLQLQVSDAAPMRKRILIAVEDSGIGIPADKQHRLFQPFAQIDASITREFGGTGLGLAIVRLFVELMQGRIGVTSEEGKGSRFWFELEMEEVNWEQESRSNGRQASLPDKDAPIEQRQILVVEDNPVNRTVINAMLTKLGFCVSFATNGKEAVDILTGENLSPVIVFMDCQMPVMDGLQATRLIRQWEKEHGREPLRIVALTAEAYQQDRDNCAAAGMDDFLPKPLVMRDLRKVLSRWLTREVPQENP